MFYVPGWGEHMFIYNVCVNVLQLVYNNGNFVTLVNECHPIYLL